MDNAIAQILIENLIKRISQIIDCVILLATQTQETLNLV